MVLKIGARPTNTMPRIDPGRCEDPHCVQTPTELPQPHVKDVVLAKDSDTDVEYANVEHHHFGNPYKLIRVLRATNRGGVQIKLFAEHIGEWLEVEVPATYRLTVAPEYLAKVTKPSDIAAKRSVDHLKGHQFVKTKEVPAEAPPDGKRVFEGKLGGSKVVMDAGNGAILGHCDAARPKPSELAAFLKKTLVKRSEATKYAEYVYVEAWKQEHKKN